jgi:hypothetical protein
MNITPAHRAAIDRLPLRPGTCSVLGCGETRICVKVEDWEGPGYPHPPPRFGCPEHDVWLGHCFDEGYPDDPEYKLGLYEATLRDVADPAWGWLPEQMHAAAARAGFGVLRPYQYPQVMIGLWDGRSWGTDDRTVIALGPESDLPGIQDRLLGRVKPEMVRRHVLPNGAVGRAFEPYERGGYAPSLPVAPTRAGYAARWDKDGIAFGPAVIPGSIHAMVSEIFPGSAWLAAGRLDPVLVMALERFVAAVMPADTVEVDRLDAGETCQARHDKSYDAGRVVLTYSCDMPPGHGGFIHEVGPIGAKHRWDEREYPRTDTAAGSPS